MATPPIHTYALTKEEHMKGDTRKLEGFTRNSVYRRTKYTSNTEGTTSGEEFNEEGYPWRRSHTEGSIHEGKYFHKKVGTGEAAKITTSRGPNMKRVEEKK